MGVLVRDRITALIWRVAAGSLRSSVESGDRHAGRARTPRTRAEMIVALVVGLFVLVAAAYGVGYDHGRATERAMGAAEQWDRLLTRARPQHRQHQHDLN